MVTGRRAALRAALLPATVLWILAVPTPVRADLRIGNLDVFLNDYDVTVHVVLFGAIPESLLEIANRLRKSFRTTMVPKIPALDVGLISRRVRNFRVP